MNSTKNIFVDSTTPASFNSTNRGSVWFDSTNNQVCYYDQAGIMHCILPGGSGITPYHGSFYDTSDQSATAINTPTAMKLNSTDLSSGVSITNNTLGNPTRITFANAGVYDIQFSAQLYRSSGGSKEVVTLWFRKNEVNIPDSGTNVSVQANADFLVTAWNIFVSVTAGQYVELFWSTTATAISIQALPESLTIPHPAIPSLIVTANRVG